MEKSLVIHNYVKTHYGVGEMWVGVSERDVDGVFSRYFMTKKSYTVNLQSSAFQGTGCFYAL